MSGRYHPCNASRYMVHSVTKTHFYFNYRCIPIADVLSWQPDSEGNVLITNHYQDYSMLVNLNHLIHILVAHLYRHTRLSNDTAVRKRVLAYFIGEEL